MQTFVEVAVLELDEKKLQFLSNLNCDRNIVNIMGSRISNLWLHPRRLAVIKFQIAKILA